MSEPLCKPRTESSNKKFSICERDLTSFFSVEFT